MRLYLFLASMLIVSSTFAKTEVIIESDDDYFPYSYVENGSPKGLYVDLINAIAERMPDYNIKVVPTP